MGITIYYTLSLPGHTRAQDVRERLQSLRDFAAAQDFDRVLGPSEYRRHELMRRDAASRREIVNLLVGAMCGPSLHFPGVPAGDSCAMAFLVVPGADCEAAVFGFVAPGSRADPGHRDIATHAHDWYWSSWCKTQYASLVSPEHLIKCHTGVVRVLEHAATLGIDVSVVDESGYWEHRSAARLVQAVNSMNRLIARFAGAMSDELEKAGHLVHAPIFDHPEFEHLEMELPDGDDQADGAGGSPPGRS